MARIAEEKPIYRISYKCIGTEKDVLAFMRAATFEYIQSNLAHIESEDKDDMHNKCA